MKVEALSNKRMKQNDEAKVIKNVFVVTCVRILHNRFVVVELHLLTSIKL